MPLTTLLHERASHQVGQLFDVRGSGVGKVRVLGMIPHLLGRVELRRVGRQVFDSDVPLMATQVLLENSCLVDTPAVENEYQGPSYVAPQHPKEEDQVAGSDVLLGLHPPVEPEPFATWGHGENANDGETIVTLPVSQDGRLASRSPCPPHQRLEHKAALIEENEASTFPTSVFLYAAIFAAATARSRPRLALAPGARASAGSTHIRSGSSRHAPDGSEPRRSVR